MALLGLPAAVNAQTLPVMELLVQSNSATEGDGCFQINVGPEGSKNGTNITPVDVHVVALTTAGPNRFVDLYGDTPKSGTRGAHPSKFLNKADGTGLISAKNANIKDSATVRVVANRNYRTGICWGDDNLDTGPSEVMLVIANGPGYTVSRAAGQKPLTITDNDDCSNPASTPGGVVYRMNGSSTCICASESRVSDVRRALTPITRQFRTAGPDGIFGNADDVMESRELTPSSPGFLSRLAAHFHDPSYLYCPDSPYKGLPE